MNTPRDHNREQQNKDIARKLGKLYIPSFDGSSKSTARAWVQKLDTIDGLFEPLCGWVKAFKPDTL
jgi:hypothetical protein